MNTCSELRAELQDTDDRLRQTAIERDNVQRYCGWVVDFLLWVVPNVACVFMKVFGERDVQDCMFPIRHGACA